MRKTKIAIIGGGASGLFCASLLANDERLSIYIYEKNNKLGKKILASGNGKCNFTNNGDYTSKYNTPFANKIISKFDANSTIDYFKSLGLIYKYDSEGRCYPYSESAVTVLNCLKSTLKGTKILLEKEVVDIYKDGNVYVVKGEDFEDRYDCVVCSSGSLASNLGSDKAYNYLKTLNVEFTRFKSSLAPVVTKEKTKNLTGVRIKCLLKLLNENKKVVYTEPGEVIFKDNGLSGIAVFNATSYMNRNNGKYSIVLDLVNNLSDDELLSYFENRNNCEFLGLFNEKLASYLTERYSKQLNSPREIVDLIRNVSFSVEKMYPLSDSQVCSGGVEIDSVNNNLSLKKHENVYVSGELLDVDGVCGGYNLQFAWSSGAVIAMDIKRRLNK